MKGVGGFGLSLDISGRYEQELKSSESEFKPLSWCVGAIKVTLRDHVWYTLGSTG